MITLSRPWQDAESDDPSSLEEAWVPGYEHGAEEILQPSKINTYQIIKVLGFASCEHVSLRGIVNQTVVTCLIPAASCCPACSSNALFLQRYPSL